MNRMKMIYTAITIDRDNKVRRVDFVSSHDSHKAWLNAIKAFTSYDSSLVALIPGNHEAITAEGRLGYNDQTHEC